MECSAYAFPTESGECHCWPGFVMQPDGSCEAPELLPHCEQETPFSERECRPIYCNDGYVSIAGVCLPECVSQCEALEVCYNGRCLPCLLGYIVDYLGQKCVSIPFCVDSDGFTCTVCATRYYLAADGTCIPCLPRCNLCLNYATCISCDRGFELVIDNEKGIALASCEQDLKVVEDQVAAPTAIKHCIVGINYLCYECQQDYLLTTDRKYCISALCGDNEFASGEGCVQVIEETDWVTYFRCIDDDNNYVYAYNCATRCILRSCSYWRCYSGYIEQPFIVDNAVVFICVADIDNVQLQVPTCAANYFVQQSDASELSCKTCYQGYYGDYNGSICSPGVVCGSKILLGCSRCGDQELCLECFAGYFLNFQNYTCASEQKSLCSQYTYDANYKHICVTCNNGAVMSYDYTRCWHLFATASDGGCTYFESYKCVRCYKDKALALITHDCVNEIAGCEVYLISYQCARCRPGYFIGSAIGSYECIPCAAGQSSDGVTCAALAPCDSIFGCVSCSLYGFCSYCAVGMKLISGAYCVWLDKCATIAGCVLCEYSNWCSLCYTGMAFDGVACRPGVACAGEFSPECKACSTAGCKYCSIGFYPNSSGQCQECSERCQYCLADSCLICEHGYGVFKGRCVKCSPSCEACTAAEHCLSCASGALPSRGSCECAAHCSKCSIALDDTACLACRSGYLMDAGQCTDTCAGGPNLITLDGLQCGKCGEIRRCTACSNQLIYKCAACAFGYYVRQEKCKLNMFLLFGSLTAGVSVLVALLVCAHLLYRRTHGLYLWNKIFELQDNPRLIVLTVKQKIVLYYKTLYQCIKEK